MIYLCFIYSFSISLAVVRAARAGFSRHSQHPVVLHQTLQLGKVPGSVLYPFSCFCMVKGRWQGVGYFLGRREIPNILWSLHRHHLRVGLSLQTIHPRALQLLPQVPKSFRPAKNPSPTSLIQLPKIPSSNLQIFPHPTPIKFPHPTSKNSLIQLLKNSLIQPPKIPSSSLLQEEQELRASGVPGLCGAEKCKSR